MTEASEYRVRVRAVRGAAREHLRQLRAQRMARRPLPPEEPSEPSASQDKGDRAVSGFAVSRAANGDACETAAEVHAAGNPPEAEGAAPEAPPLEAPVSSTSASEANTSVSTAADSTAMEPEVPGPIVSDLSASDHTPHETTILKPENRELSAPEPTARIPATLEPADFRPGGPAPGAQEIAHGPGVQPESDGSPQSHPTLCGAEAVEGVADSVNGECAGPSIESLPQDPVIEISDAAASSSDLETTASPPQMEELSTTEVLADTWVETVEPDSPEPSSLTPSLDPTSDPAMAGPERVSIGDGDTEERPTVEENPGSRPKGDRHPNASRPETDLYRLRGAGPGLVWMLSQCEIHALQDLAAADADVLVERLGIVGQLLDVPEWIAFAQEAVSTDTEIC